MTETASSPADPDVPTTSEPAEDPFEMAGFNALPRLSGLTLSPDGSRLVVGVARLNDKRTKWVSALWEVDPEGVRPARRLTRSTKGEAGAAFTPAGDLLFTSSRPDVDVADADAVDRDDPATSLWVLPGGGGEARVVATRPGGITRLAVARDAGTVVLASPTLPSSSDADAEAAGVKARKDAKVTAILHESYPVRFWDADLGPDHPRLLASAAPPGDGDDRLALRDLTGHVGHALLEAGWDVSPDGSTIVSTWVVPEGGGSLRETLVAIDVATCERRVLVDDVEHEYFGAVVSPDSSRAAVVRAHRSTPHDPGDLDIVLVSLADGRLTPVAEAWDRWPVQLRWTPDGAALVVVADEGGRAPVFRIDVGSDPAAADPVRLTADDGAYTDVEVSPDGRFVYALRSAVDAPPAPVRVPLGGPADGAAYEPLPGPADALDQVVTVPGRLEEVTATADDGSPLRAWLCLPGDAGAYGQVPLLLWIHGGPLGSWNAWSWRWNPWLMVQQGYAVLLPDPGLSTGYGVGFVKRGWGAWGAEPYTDLLAITDAAGAHDAVDASRTAAMGGSFGGYMANWVAGHTDRFDAIVTHASLWALDQFGPTTDAAWYWSRELTPEAALANSPHRFADAITTPVLVIHGDKDYRVPIGEGLRLWWDLASRSTAADGSTPHRFHYFPDENHWVLTPGNAAVWYATVLAFLAQHVLGEQWKRPDLLG